MLISRPSQWINVFSRVERTSFTNCLDIWQISHGRIRNNRSRRRHMCSWIYFINHWSAAIPTKVNKLLNTVDHSIVVFCLSIIGLSSSKFLHEVGLKVSTGEHFFNCFWLCGHKVDLMLEVYIVFEFFSDMADVHLFELFKSDLSIYFFLVILDSCIGEFA